ncbi:hypothetical protein GQ55_8G205800 [Panicum hallii var. hallii]|uniref:Uncharacterized protein n=1 Tax=Panicum hallii var. hallii TaxID=1504633 RepID=A0A2T7CPH3_9POAL|nr:hypothetical protein GQ55_8G205800 [Panicum hallii var. hallii]
MCSEPPDPPWIYLSPFPNQCFKSSQPPAPSALSPNPHRTSALPNLSLSLLAQVKQHLGSAWSCMHLGQQPCMHAPWSAAMHVAVHACRGRAGQQPSCNQ